MGKFGSALASLSFSLLTMSPAVSQDITAQGSVIEFLGAQGELIVSREGIIFYLQSGDELFLDDILRTKDEDTTTISFRGCAFELPAATDVTLDDEFCNLASATETMAEKAVIALEGVAVEVVETTENSPLLIGGVILSAGGLSAFTGQGGGSSASDPVVTSSATSNGSNASSP